MSEPEVGLNFKLWQVFYYRSTNLLATLDSKALHLLFRRRNYDIESHRNVMSKSPANTHNILRMKFPERRAAQTNFWLAENFQDFVRRDVQDMAQTLFSN